MKSPKQNVFLDPVFLGKTALAVMLFTALGLYTYTASADESAAGRSSVNMTVDSADQPLSIDKKTDPEQKPDISNASAMALDDSGQPAMNTKF